MTRRRSCEIPFGSGQEWPISLRLAARWPLRSHCCAASSEPLRILDTSRGAPVSAAWGTRASSPSRSIPVAGSRERQSSWSPQASRGRWGARQRCRSTTRRSFAARCDAPTPFSRSAAAGCCAGWRLTAAGSNSRSPASRLNRPSCSMPWAPRPPTSTSVRVRLGSRRSAGTSSSDRPTWLKVASRAMERVTTDDYLDWHRAQRG